VGGEFGLDGIGKGGGLGFGDQAVMVGVGLGGGFIEDDVGGFAVVPGDEVFTDKEIKCFMGGFAVGQRWRRRKVLREHGIVKGGGGELGLEAHVVTRRVVVIRGVDAAREAGKHGEGSQQAGEAEGFIHGRG